MVSGLPSSGVQPKRALLKQFMKKNYFFKSSVAAVVALFMASCTDASDNPVVPEELYDLDVTELVATDGWGGAWCATQYAPAVKTADGRVSQMMENYQTNVDATGVILQQTLEGLKNGNYKVELYANAFYTDGRGFESDMQDGAMDVAYVFANEVKCPVVGQIATATNKNGEYALEVKVTDGTLTLGLGKEKAGTNWHTIQIKSLVLENGTNVKPETPEEVDNTDFTDLVNMDVTSWNAGGNYGVEVATSDGRIERMVEHYYNAFPCDEFPMHQTVSGLEDGTYTVVLYATSNLAWISSDVEAGAMDVAYVYAKCGDKIVKQPIPAGRETGFTEPGKYTIEIDVTGGEIELGLGLEKQDMTNWHTIQIKSLKLKAE